MSKKIIPFPEERLGLLAILLDVSEETITDALSYKTNSVEAVRIRQIVTVREKIIVKDKIK